LGKLKVLSGNEACKILSENAFERVRQKGSHVVMQKKIPGSTITVPVPNHKEISKGTLLSIIKQSKLPRRFFES